MRGTQNQLERFRSIAKKLVDEHSAEVFVRSAFSSENGTDDVYFRHLDVLDKELNEQAEQFIGTYKAVNDEVKTEIWDTCRKYIDQFVKRNQPTFY
ncbi:MAG TPA: hypothetical protein PL009_05620 [Flavipsychrobacter sp.]|nr:hypothetical protein [Flavipsychrobacter sp.]